MKSHAFDQVTRALASGASRRALLRAAGGAMAAAATGGGWPLRRASAQRDDDQPFEFKVRPDFDPIFVSPDPIPLGGNEFLLDGNTFTIDPEVAASIQDTPFVPLAISGDTYFVNPEVLTSAISLPEGTPAAGDFPTPAPVASPIPPAEAQCPGNFSQDIERYDGSFEVTIDFAMTHQRPVGNLRWNDDLRTRYADPGIVNSRRWCSGTLISEDLFLTAAHCFDQCPNRTCSRPPQQCPLPCPSPPLLQSAWEVPKIDGTSNPIPRAEIATRMHVDFDYQLDPGERLRVWESFDVIELVEDQLGGLDYAILRLANTPGLRFSKARISAVNAAVGSVLCIIGYPNGMPKQIEAGHASEIRDDKIYYDDISTLPVSSGSGILSSPSGAIVGVHTNGGCNDIAFGNNHGVSIESLLRESPTLRALAASPTA